MSRLWPLRRLGALGVDKIILASLLTPLACSCPPAADPQAPGGEPRAEQITVPSRGLGPQPVVVLLPMGYDAARARPYPLLVAFSGRGEALLPPSRGSWGWVRDYQLRPQVRALGRGRLVQADFHGLVSSSWLARYNRALAAAPYAGMVVACPHTYDLLGHRRLGHAAYERFYLEELPAALRKRYHLRRDVAGLGLDGVSLGGLWSVYLGLAHPRKVGQVGALQPAVTPFLARLGELAARGAEQQLRRPLSLVSSSGDGLRPVVSRLSALLREEGVDHSFTLLTGPHDYIFNRGPGGIHMLLWHDRKFRGLEL